MKNNLKIIWCISALIFILLWGCGRAVKPSSTITSEKRTVQDFNSIEVSRAFTVYVNITDHEGIEIEANENIHKYIVIENESGKLIIRLQDNIYIMGHPVLKVYVSVKKLNDFTASGASNFILQDTLKTEGVKIKLSGASSFTGAIETATLSAKLSGASSLNLAGITELFELGESGASNAENFNFICKNLNAHLSGASRARFTVNEKLTVEASGASELAYKGTAALVSQNLSGASSLNKR